MARSAIIVTMLGLTTSATACTTRQLPDTQCVSTSPIVGVDQITLAVSDLSTARAQAQDLGFRIKDGRLHANGIRNAHIKTRRGSVELLTVSDENATLDAQSTEYVDFIAAGEGGAFLALSGAPIDSVALLLDPLGVAYQIDRGALFSYLTFPVGSPLRHVYFLQTNHVPGDADSLLAHMNGASRISGVGLDGDPELASVLKAVGAVVCAEDASSTRMRLGDVALTLRPSPRAGRGKIRGVEFQVYTLGRPPTNVSGLTFGWAPPT